MFAPVGDEQKTPAHGDPVDPWIAAGVLGGAFVGLAEVGAADVGFTVVVATTAGVGFGGTTGARAGLTAFRVMAAGTGVTSTGVGVMEVPDDTGICDTTTGGGVAFASSGSSEPRSVEAHAVVAATTTTATIPNPAHGSSVRSRPGRRTIGTIVVRSSR